MFLQKLILIGGICLSTVFNVQAKGLEHNPVRQKKALKAVKKVEWKPSVEYKDFAFTYDKVEYNTVNAPVFSTTKMVIFQEVSVPKRDDRYLKVISALAKHEKEKPVGWEELIAGVAEEPDDLKKLKMANSIINKVPYKDGTDGSYYHPAKLYKKGGVCKDMAVAKYLLLKEAGYSIDKMRLAVLTPKTDKPESPFHVVLVVRANEKDYVLDLMPSYLAEQERTKLKTTKEKQIKVINEAGLDLDDFSEKELLTSKGFYNLDKYVSERGLIWSGNELGSRSQFIEKNPLAKKAKRKILVAKK